MTRLWIVGAWWLLPITLAAGLVVASQLAIPEFSQPLAAAARVSESAPLVLGFASAAAALVVARLRESALLVRPHVRWRLRIVVDLGLDIVAVGVVSGIVAVLWGQVGSGVVGWPGWGVLLVHLAVLLAVVAWGMAFGRWCKVWLAAPLAFVATYLVLGFPAAMNPLWLRHLVGVSGGCCTADTTLSPRVIGAATLVAVGESSRR